MNTEEMNKGMKKYYTFKQGFEIGENKEINLVLQVSVVSEGIDKVKVLEMLQVADQRCHQLMAEEYEIYEKEQSIGSVFIKGGTGSIFRERRGE